MTASAKKVRPIKEHVMSFEKHYQLQLEHAQKNVSEAYNYSEDKVKEKLPKIPEDQLEKTTELINNSGVPLENWKPWKAYAKKKNYKYAYMGAKTAHEVQKGGGGISGASVPSAVLTINDDDEVDLKKIGKKK